MSEEREVRDLQHQAASRASLWESLSTHAGWNLYAAHLKERRDQLVREMRQCLRKGDGVGAMLKEIASSTIEDCLDLPRIEAGNAEWTADQHESTIREGMAQWQAHTRSR